MNHPDANHTLDGMAVSSKWTLSGVRLTDESIFVTNGNSIGLATVQVAYSQSKPVDFEFSDEVRVTIAAEVVVKVLHDTSGQPNASLPIPASGPDEGSHNWTTFALPIASQRVNFVILDSQVSTRAGSDCSCS